MFSYLYGTGKLRPITCWTSNWVFVNLHSEDTTKCYEQMNGTMASSQANQYRCSAINPGENGLSSVRESCCIAARNACTACMATSTSRIHLIARDSITKLGYFQQRIYGILYRNKKGEGSSTAESI
jgi:hypothetical protein